MAPKAHLAAMVRNLPLTTLGLDMVHEVGGKALLIEKAWQVIEQTPEGRSLKVAALREIIHKGNYKIDCNRLAHSIFREVLSMISAFENH